VIVIVCGGRNYSNRDRVYSALNAVHAKKTIKMLIQGGADGADRIAKDWAMLIKGIQVVTFHASWIPLGGAAGPIRNANMLIMKPDGLIAFNGGDGTKGMIALAESGDVKVWRVPE